ncbi:MAG: hypothetical protein HQM10_17280 [Candidatus Riflebacteria bacterium]|nr:hypothetical protein [Candidatus Riflebacteria bacterium]
MRKFNLTVLSVVFSVLPFFAPIPLLYVLFQYFASITESEQITNNKKALEELDRINSHILRISKPEEAFRKVVKDLAEKLSTDDSLDFPELLNSKHLTAYLFNSDGKRIIQKPFSEDSIKISELFLREILEKRFTGDKKVIHFAGSKEALETISENPDNISNLAETGQKRLAGWFSIKKRDKTIKYLVVFINLENISINDILNKNISKFQEKLGNSFFLGAISTNKTIVSDPKKFLQNNNSLIDKIFSENYQSHFSHNNKAISVVFLSPAIKLIAARHYSFSRQPGIVIPALVIIFSAYLFFCFFLITFRENISTSIRTEIILIFSLAGFLSILFFLFSFSLYRSSRENNLIIEAQEESRKLLEQIDGNFHPSFQSTVQSYVNLAENIKDNPDKYLPLLQKLSEIKSEAKIMAAFFIDTSEKILFQIPENLSELPRNIVPVDVESIIKRVAKNCLYLFNSSFDQEKKKDFSESNWNLLLEKPTLKMLASRGKLQTLNLGKKDIISFIDLITDKKGKAWGILLIFHTNADLEHQFLSKTRMSLHNSGDFNLFAFPNTRNQSEIKSVPENFGFTSDTFLSINDFLSKYGTEKHQIAAFNDSQHLFTALPGKTLMDYNLFLLRPYKPILEKLNSLSRNFLLIAIFLVFFAISAGVILTKNVFFPFQKISHGIESLVDLKTGSPIHMKSGDEFQTTADAINNITQNLQEIMLTKSLQEELLPEVPLKKEGISIKGSAITNREISTIVHDYFEISPNKFLIYSAKVTGQGFSPAMTISMFKTAVRLAGEFPSSSPTEILNNVKSFFSKNVGKDLELSIVLALLNRNDQSLGICVNKGAHFLSVAPSGAIVIQTADIIPLNGLSRAVLISGIDDFEHLLKFLKRNSDFSISSECNKDFSSEFSAGINGYVASRMNSDDEISMVCIEMSQRFAG